MKKLLKTLLVLTILGMQNTLLASSVIDDTLKGQCKFILYGQFEGTNNDQGDGYLLGFIQGIEYLTDKEDLTDFFKSRSYRMVKERACKNSLENSRLQFRCEKIPVIPHKFVGDRRQINVRYKESQ